jgi:hypothetical protein
MSDGITNLGEHRRRTCRPISATNIVVAHYAPSDRPEVILRGHGDQVASIDFKAVGRDLAFASISLGNLGRHAKLGAPVAVATIFSDGTINVQLELSMFEHAADRDWLNEQLGKAQRVADAILDEEEASRNAATSDG